MLIKSLQIGVIGLFLCIANACTTDQTNGNSMVSVPAETGSTPNTWTGPSSIQGIVKDAKGQPIKGADVRIESRDGRQLFNAVKTDTKGRYISQGLQPGVYRVSLIVNGAVKASITNTKAKADRATQLNFDLQPAKAAQTTQKKGKHLVWIPPATGSHMGGRWVEADEGGAAAAGALNVKKASAEELQRQAQTMGHGGGGQ